MCVCGKKKIKLMIRHNVILFTIYLSQSLYLNRILGFYRAAPTIGRNINMVVEMLRVSPPRLQRTFFVSPKPDENMCFSGNCELYCDSYHPMCGNGNMIEVCFHFSLLKFRHKFAFWSILSCY